MDICPNISCSPLPFGLLSLQVSGNGITFSHVELPNDNLDTGGNFKEIGGSLSKLTQLQSN